MAIRVRPAYRRKQIGPRKLHLRVDYVLFSRRPRITSVAIQSKVWGETYTHNLFTSRNTLSAHDIGSIQWGNERPRQQARRRGHHVISTLIWLALIAFLVLLVIAVVVGLAAVHAIVPVLHSFVR
jgi:hypothetical protein